jgi:hypothetical protein
MFGLKENLIAANLFNILAYRGKMVAVAGGRAEAKWVRGLRIEASGTGLLI